MKKQMLLWILALSQFLCLFSSAAHREEARGTVLPKGVTEINLGTVLGSGAANVIDAWMPNANICVLLRSRLENEEYNDMPIYYEIVVLDMRDLSVLSRTPVLHASYYSPRGWEGGAFHFWFIPIKVVQDNPLYWIEDVERSYLCICVFPDGTVDTDNVMRSNLTVMQGGKTGIRTAIDGSLYAVDLAMGGEELLVQGIPRNLWASDAPEEIKTEAAFEAYAKYIPCWDELDYHWVNREEINFYNVREFHVYRALDEDRFVYTVSGWEWSGAGYGIYDLRTRTDHRITGNGDFFGLFGDTLFGEATRADVNTYETTTLPELVQEQFDAAARWDTDTYVEYDISQDGKILAITGMIARSIEEKRWWNQRGFEPKFDYAHTVTLTDIQTGELIKAYDIDNPLATERTVAFYDDTHVMLFCRPKEERGTAYIYLLNIEE